MVEPLIGHGDDAGVGVDGAEGIVGRLGLGRGEGVEDGAFADVGQANDSAVQWQEMIPFVTTPAAPREDVSSTG